MDPGTPSKSGAPREFRTDLDKLAAEFGTDRFRVKAELDAMDIRHDPSGNLILNTLEHERLGLALERQRGMGSSRPPQEAVNTPPMEPSAANAPGTSAGDKPNAGTRAPGLPDFAFVIGRTESDGRTVFPNAGEKVQDMKLWLMSVPGPAVPADNIFPPVSRNWINADAGELEMQFAGIISAVKKSPAGARRLYIYAAGPVFPRSEKEDAYFLAPMKKDERFLGLALRSMAEVVQRTGLFQEIILLVDGVEVEQPGFNLTSVFGPADRITRLLSKEPSRPPAKLFAAISRTPDASAFDPADEAAPTDGPNDDDDPEVESGSERSSSKKRDPASGKARRMEKAPSRMIKKK